MYIVHHLISAVSFMQVCTRVSIIILQSVRWVWTMTNEIEIKSNTVSHFVDKQGSFLRLLLTVTIVFLCHALEQNNDSYWAPIQLDTKLGSSKLSNEQAFHHGRVAILLSLSLHAIDVFTRIACQPYLGCAWIDIPMRALLEIFNDKTNLLQVEVEEVESQTEELLAEEVHASLLDLHMLCNNKTALT